MTRKKTVFRFPSMSQLDKTEAWLSKMEADGWRLEDAKFPFFYTFKRTNARDAKYFFTQFSKNFSLQNIASSLQEEGWFKEFSNGSSLTVYRKPDQEDKPAQAPKKYLQQRCQELKSRTFNNAMFCLVVAVASAVFMFFDPNIWFSLIFLILSVGLTGYYVYGHLYIRKRLEELSMPGGTQKQLKP